jgi:uncharacterized protein (DUF302 family)
MKKVIVSLSALVVIAGKTSGQNVKEPYYMVDFTAVHCKFEIQINKVSMFTMNVNGQMGTRIPCNYLILESGEQQLDIIVQPCTGESGFEENSEFSAVIKLYDAPNEFTLIEDHIVACAMNSEDRTEAAYRHTARFKAEVPYRITAWQNSEDLNSVENLREKLEAAYKKIGDMITRKQYDAFINSIRERENRMAVSMYLNSEESKERMDGYIEDFQGGLELLPLSGRETVRIYAGGKLACLVTDDGDSALQFRNEKNGEEMILDMMFHLKKGDTELSVAP